VGCIETELKIGNKVLVYYPTEEQSGSRDLPLFIDRGHDLKGLLALTEGLCPEGLVKHVLTY